MQDMWVWSLGEKDPLEEGMATHSSILAWRIPQTEEPGRLQSIGSQRVGHEWSDLACRHAHSRFFSSPPFIYYCNYFCQYQLMEVFYTLVIIHFSLLTLDLFPVSPCILLAYPNHWWLFCFSVFLKFFTFCHYKMQQYHVLYFCSSLRICLSPVILVNFTGE